MITYVFDGSFEGLLTSIYDAYYEKNKPEEIVSLAQFQQSLINKPIYITTELQKYTKVYTAIKNKISSDALETIYHVFLSELPGSSTLIYEYIRLGFKLGSKVNLHLHEDCVINMHTIERKVVYECHRMLGFVRFKLVNNMYYSSIEPDYNILGLIAPHFSARLPKENWIIHDLGRSLAIFYNKSEWIVSVFEAEKSDNFVLKESSELYEDLWTEFFNTIAIADRKNPKYQKRNMPKRYWKYLTELNK